MATIRITVHDTDTDTYWYTYPSAYQIKKYDNGALLSRGWTVPEDLPRAVWRRWNAQGITQDEYNHSGCLSRCTRRGDSTCQW